MAMFTRKLGIDLGTANILVYIPGKGVVLNEPSVVAVSEFEQKILAVGSEAKTMIGKTPDDIIAYRPMKNGVIASFLDGLGNSLGYGGILLLVAFFRELFGSGSIFGSNPIIPEVYHNGLMLFPAGAFIILGIIIWAQRSLTNYVEE